MLGPVTKTYALSRPPRVCPTRSAISSVPKPISFARGIMAKNVVTKTTVSLALTKCKACVVSGGHQSPALPRAQD